MKFKNINKRRFFILIFVISYFFLWNPTVFAQSNEYFQASKIIPPSPTAGSLAKVVDIDVGYFTGTHQLNIPLINVESKGIPITVNLLYNSANGIKPIEDASWIGLGWTLATGGVITRSIRGMDDFKFGGFPSAVSLPPHNEDNYVAPPATSAEQTSTANYFRQVGNRSIDSEPDVFYYNFMGKTGKFFLGKISAGDTIYVEKQTNLKIELLERTINAKWRITDADGYRYFFRTPEVVSNYYKNSDVTQFSGLEPNFTNSYDDSESAWYLDSIVDPHGKIAVKFEYETGLSLSAIQIYQKRYDLLNQGATNAGTMASVYNFTSSNRQRIQNIYLKKIIYNKGSILFTRTQREDIEPVPYSNDSQKPQKLSQITLYSQNNTVTKNIVLSQSYFNSGYAGNDRYAFLRLKLDSVSEIGSSGEKQPPHSFSYYAPQDMPSKYTRQIDEWGYYSSFPAYVIPGEVTQTLLPTVKTYKGSTLWTFQGVNRVPDSVGSYVKRGIIESVSYPTGGRTKFEYETNEQRSLPYQKIITSEVAKADGSDMYSEVLDHFSITGAQEIAFDLTCYPIAEDRIPNNQIVAYLRNSSNVVLRAFSISDPKATLYLQQGNYTIEVVFNSEYVTILYASTVQYKTYNRKAAGGLRIKSISDLSRNNVILRKKSFVYDDQPYVNGAPSSKVIYPNRYYSRACKQYLDDNSSTSSNGLYLIRTSGTINSLEGNAASSHVTYSDVFVFEGEDKKNGYTHYNYYNLGANHTFVEPEMPLVFSELNGKLNFVEYFDNKNTLLKKNEYQYQLLDRKKLKSARFMKPNTDTSPFFNYEDGDIRYFDNISEWWVLIQDNETTFDKGNQLSKYRRYFYENSIHKLLTKIVESQSNLDTISTIFKYPMDILTPLYNEMVTRHILSPKVMTERKRNAISFFWQKQNYLKFPNGVISTESDQESKDGVNYYTLTKYLSYDVNGNPTSMSKGKDAPTSYVWGYDKSLPIVQAFNVSGTLLETKVQEAVIELGYITLDAFLTAIGDLRGGSQKLVWYNFNEKLKQKLPAESMFLTFAYHPQYGKVCSTDANNRSKYYEYDGLGRLQLIRDQNGAVLETYKYQYKL
ncbi:hypothetical protein D7322_28070 [Sphingobacterium puteale]|uniref:RHS repeat protein n=1 Tax=Sphingobacterium puteale TaxID=2420510 RepID=A0A420VPN4_9SPHI|nr:hypothetical protein [Sphingobacterium puteale]RKO68279.1 hypothetical protein D7322_28070 [Sphingobacterium puteale]